jgi:actin related protein 2/3 complex subunit 3
MPVYHSTLTDEKAQVVCSASILPLRTSLKGSAPTADPESTDIVDESITFFRANILFRLFEVEGGADRILCYLTVYIADCIFQVTKVEFLP